MAETTNIWTKTYTSFGGCDIVALIENMVIGNLQGISFSVTREKGPIYVMGAADPVSFSRGKRGIAGSMVFTNFDRAALHDIINGGNSGFKSLDYYKKRLDIPAGGRSYGLGDALPADNFSTPTEANYPDQIPPFNVNITAANEYGQAMVMGIYGCELLNQGQGISVDDMVTETQFTFVCRALTDWTPQSKSSKISTSISEVETGTAGSLASKIEKTEAYNAVSKYDKLPE